MDYQELKTKTESQLHELLREERDALRDVRFKASAGALKNTKAPSKIKKTIARILTMLHANRTEQENGKKSDTHDVSEN
jgi:ribosomal protein L29